MRRLGLDRRKESLLNYTTIVVEDQALVRTITLNRPERRNAMTPEMQGELIQVLGDTASSDRRVLVLTGAGDAFCSGLDLSVLQAIGMTKPQRITLPMRNASRSYLSRYMNCGYRPSQPYMAPQSPAAQASQPSVTSPLQRRSQSSALPKHASGLSPRLCPVFLAMQIDGRHVRDTAFCHWPQSSSHAAGGLSHGSRK